MKPLITIFLLLFTANTFAQNVGIGVTLPDEKLQVDSVIRIGKNAVIATGSTRKNTIKFGDGNFATIGEQDKDDRLVLNAGSFSFRTGKVGIGLDSATEKLDVAGDIKADTILPKAIRMATNAGDGKVLTSDAGGNATWQSLGSKAGYKYCKQIIAEGFGSFTVPAGVNEIMVEAWGGGSGASYGNVSYAFGGTSGGYIRTVQTVTPGAILTYTVGEGSFDAIGSGNVSPGGNTTFNFTVGNIQAFGGVGHTSNDSSPGIAKSGTGTVNNYIALFGYTGGSPTFEFGQKSSTIFTETIRWGNGGMAVGFNDAARRKGQFDYYENGIIKQIYNDAAFSNFNPSTGGGGSSTGSYGGGDGMLLIWYN